MCLIEREKIFYFASVHDTFTYHFCSSVVAQYKVIY